MLKSSNINIMSNSLLKASKILRRDFNEIENLQNSSSKINIFVERSMNNVKDILLSELKKARPSWQIIFKEGNAINESFINKETIVFLVKPISGVANYSKGISYFSTSITLIQKNVQEATVIYDPIKDELFYCERGKGAFVNNFRIRISSKKNLYNSLVAIENSEILIEKIKFIFKKKDAIIRIFGSNCLDFANLASGRIDCFINKISSNNFEPGLLLVKEAGGINLEKIGINGIFFYSNNEISDVINSK